LPVVIAREERSGRRRTPSWGQHGRTGSRYHCSLRFPAPVGGL
jgi:hypothetical protein